LLIPPAERSDVKAAMALTIENMEIELRLASKPGHRQPLVLVPGNQSIMKQSR
jgi:hypothetical protein